MGLCPHPGSTGLSCRGEGEKEGGREGGREEERERRGERPHRYK